MSLVLLLPLKLPLVFMASLASLAVTGRDESAARWPVSFVAPPSIPTGSPPFDFSFVLA